MKINKYVSGYINSYKKGEILFNEERRILIDYLERDIFSRDDLYFDDQKIEDYIKFTEKWYFPLEPFQKFIAAFIFLYHDDGMNFYQDFMLEMGRGAGKNGFISTVGHYLISPFHGIKEYNGSIVANSEEQATTSIKEIQQVVNGSKSLTTYFYATNTRILSRQTNSELKYRTSNGNTKDGLRDGFVIFDEIHEYQDDKNVKVHLSGLGKKKNPRIFYIGTDGYVRDGFMDEKKKLARKVLEGKTAPDRMFPFICKLDNKEQMDNPDLWELANPMLTKPLKGYAKDLFRQIKKDYDDLEDSPGGLEEFLTKRMDIPSQSMERSVAPWEEIAATNRPIPDDLEGREAIGSVDFASIRDFMAAAVTIKHGNDLVTLQHQWALKNFADKYYGYSRNPNEAAPNKRLNIPLKDWEKHTVWNGDNLIDVQDKSILDPHDALDWMIEMRKHFNIKKVVMDNYRAQIMRKIFEEAGFEVIIIKNPTAIDGLIASIIDDGFPRNRFIWGDNPLLRWNTNNVLVKSDARGNKQYLKKEEVRRKTDGFKAFEYTLYAIDLISDVDIKENVDLISSLDF